MKTRSLSFIAILVTALAPSFAGAATETIALWKLEGPIGTTEGAPISGDVIKGEAGSPELLIMGNPGYSKDGPAGVTHGSIKFQPGDALHLDQPVTDLVDLFGVEMWVKSDDSLAGRGVILLNNGRSQPGFGYGLLQTSDNEYRAIYDGVDYLFNPVDPIPVTGEWTHLALVRDAADFGTQIYANGKLIFSTERPNPAPVSPVKAQGAFVIGGSMIGNNSIRAAFEGQIALVRVFKFKQGQFKPKDLLTGNK